MDHITFADWSSPKDTIKSIYRATSTVRDGIDSAHI